MSLLTAVIIIYFVKKLKIYRFFLKRLQKSYKPFIIFEDGKALPLVYFCTL